jgi:hypothetical protein
MLFQQVHSIGENKTFNYLVIGFSVCIIALTLLFWPIAAILRKHYGKPLTLTDSARRRRTVTHIVCLVIVVFLVGFVVLFSSLEKPGGLGSAGDLKIHLLQILGLFTGLGALIVIYNALKSWSDKQQWLWYRIWNALLAVACVGFFWFIFHWNLLSFHLNY